MKLKKGHFKITSVILVLALGPVMRLHAAGSASADPAADKLPELALYKRCFTQLTGRQPSRTAPLTTKVRSGELTAVNACMAVLNAVAVDSSTGTTTASSGVLAAGDDPDTLKYQVLRKFNDFHRTWFSADSFFNSGVTTHDAQIYDETGPALYITRALFAPASFSTIVTHSGELEGVRTAGSQDLNKYSYLSTYISEFNNYDAAGTTGAKLQTGAAPLGSQSGDLIGIREMSASRLSLTRATRHNRRTQSAVHNHQGGGILGSMPFLLLNHGLAEGTKSDGGVYVARRHAKNVFRDLLCRDIPPLRELDAVSFVTPAASQTASTPAFRTASTCMACHAALDNFAGTTRPLYIGETLQLNTTSPPRAPSFHMEVQAQSAAAETTVPDSDADFGKRPPKGRLYYRSYDGTLIDQNVTGLAEMGAAIATKNDLYVCAAKKYFEYFTGLSVSLQDTGNPLSSVLSAADEYYRDEVIKLGLSLKSHGSLKTLVQEILNLELYQSRGQRAKFETSSSTSSRKSATRRKK